MTMSRRRRHAYVRTLVAVGGLGLIAGLLLGLALGAP
jgi:hypothetical protein